MKDISEMKFPENLRYSEEHEWASLDDVVKIGISDYAQAQLGDIVFVELPDVGTSLDKGDEFGTVESVKAVSELYMPISGEIVSVNEKLEDTPEHVNQDCYGKGWMITVKPSDPAEIAGLLKKDAYLAGLEDS